MKRAKVTMALDGKGGFLIEARRAAARVFVHETDGGGLFFEVAMERGGRIYPSAERSRSTLCTVTPETENSHSETTT